MLHLCYDYYLQTMINFLTIDKINFKLKFVFSLLLQASRKLILKDVYLSSFYGDMLTKCSKKAVLRL